MEINRSHARKLVCAIGLGVALLFSPVTGQDVYSVPTTENPITDIFFVDASSGWYLQACGQEGVSLLRTSDGGDTWQSLASRMWIGNLFFLNRDEGWAIESDRAKGHSRRLLRTDDGGRTWTEAALLPPLNVGGLVFLDSEKGFLIGTSESGVGHVLEFTSTGRHVRLLKSVSGEGPFWEIFADSRTVWVVGRKSILYSNGRGNRWRQVLDEETVPSASFAGGTAVERTAWAVGGAGTAIILKSEAGLNFQLVFTSKESGYFNGVAFRNRLNGCAVGNLTHLYCTSDGGNSWKSVAALPQPVGEQRYDMGHTYRKVAFSKDDSRIWVLADGGFLFQSDDSGISWRQTEATCGALE